VTFVGFHPEPEMWTLVGEVSSAEVGGGKEWPLGDEVGHLLESHLTGVTSDCIATQEYILLAVS